MTKNMRSDHNFTEEEDKVFFDNLAKIYFQKKKFNMTPDEKKFSELESGDSRFKRASSQVSTSVYGEITLVGVEQVIRKFRKIFDNPDAVFYDIGCGAGRMVNHVRCATKIKKVCGIELCPLRYAVAEELASNMDFNHGKPEFIKGNFLEQDYSDAHIAYIDNTGYSLGTLKEIENLLPPECIIVYKSKFSDRGDPSFRVETTYNRKIAEDGYPDDKLFEWSYLRAGWRPAGGWPFDREEEE